LNSHASWKAQLQPRYVADFRCIGAACEDTCCHGWRVNVDEETYQRYQQVADTALRTSFDQLITINTQATKKTEYASLVLTEGGCSFLSERLCSIQTKLGESYLPKTCATYPRNFQVVGDTLEATLDLSCPEAARLALSASTSMDLLSVPLTTPREGGERLQLPDAEDGHKQNSSLTDVRGFVVSLLKNRDCPLSLRLLILGHFCQYWDELTINGSASAAAWEQPSEVPQIQPKQQLQIVLEIILDRIGSDFTGRRFLDCYREFMEGVQWTTQSTMSDLAHRYTEAELTHFARVEASHPHIFENYLINYVYKTLFPFGTRALAGKLGTDHGTQSATTQYLLLISHYAVLRTVAIGMAGFHGPEFSPELLRKVIQSGTKTFEHSLTFPRRTLEILSKKALHTPEEIAILFAAATG
jgi:lysine-N-methylase